MEEPAEFRCRLGCLSISSLFDEQRRLCKIIPFDRAVDDRPFVLEVPVYFFSKP